jgi:Flp pilus assembly protein TadB
MVRRIAWFLSIVGILVFAAATAMLFNPASHIRVPAIAALVTFAAIVLAHLSGIEWGLALRDESGNDMSRAIALGISSVSSLAAWGVLWLQSPLQQIGAALALFVIVWAADLWMSRHGLLPSWFVDMRTAVTMIVTIILGVALWVL